MGLISDYCSNKLFSITPPFRAGKLLNWGEGGGKRGLIEKRRFGERDGDMTLSGKDGKNKIHTLVVGREMGVRDWHGGVKGGQRYLGGGQRWGKKSGEVVTETCLGTVCLL